MNFSLIFNSLVQTSYEWTREGLTITKKSFTTNSDYQSLLSPDIWDEWQMSAQLASDHPIVNSAHGWQNVSFQSRIYSKAHSKLHNRSVHLSPIFVSIIIF